MVAESGRADLLDLVELIQEHLNSIPNLSDTYRFEQGYARLSLSTFTSGAWRRFKMGLGKFEYPNSPLGLNPQTLLYFPSKKIHLYRLEILAEAAKGIEFGKYVSSKDVTDLDPSPDFLKLEESHTSTPSPGLSMESTSAKSKTTWEDGALSSGIASSSKVLCSVSRPETPTTTHPSWLIGVGLH